MVKSQECGVRMGSTVVQNQECGVSIARNARRGVLWSKVESVGGEHC